MKKINIQNIDLLTTTTQSGSNSELYEFSLAAISKLNDTYLIYFSYTNNTNGLSYNGWFELSREILDYTDEKGRNTDVCKMNVEFWQAFNPNSSLKKDTVIPITVIKHYDLLYLFLKSYINQIIG